MGAGSGYQKVGHAVAPFLWNGGVTDPQLNKHAPPSSVLRIKLCRKTEVAIITERLVKCKIMGLVFCG